MARLTTIATGIKALLATITTANGYSVDIGTIGQPDMALVTFPSVDITYVSEEAQDYTKAYLDGWENVEFQLKIRVSQLAVEEIPIRTVDAMYDDLIHDIKRVFKNCNNRLDLSLADYPVITYKSFQRETDAAGDVLMPGSCTMRFNVFYQTY